MSTIAKQKRSCKFILKIHSDKLRRCNFEYSFSLDHKHKDLISLSNSEILRTIDRLKGRDTELEAREIKSKIKFLNNQDYSIINKNKIAKLYDELYQLQFEPSYVEVIMDKKSDYDRCNRKLIINGIHYKRLLGTTGGIKKSTIIYISEDIYDIISEKIDCGRDLNKPCIPAKLSAYKALICSNSIPVSMPKGIIVVPDAITHFKDDYILIDDTQTEEPIVETIHNGDIELDDSDGYGLMLPSISKRWCEELGESDFTEYLSGVNLRGLPFTKGMLFTFDYVKFAEKIANNYMIKDVWGNWRDVRDSEIILTESMLKLWDSYSSWEDYEEKFTKYNYQIAIAKTSPHKLDEVRTTNYQFLQSYKLSDEDLDELIKPTVDEFNDILGLDYRKTLLFTKGTELNDKNIWWRTDDSSNFGFSAFIDALLIEPRIIYDEYVRNSVKNTIKKKINNAKKGVIKVRGNFAIIGGDPYLLAQSIFGLPKTGLLKKGECYHKFWSDKKVDEIACFRAPMTSHNNIRKMNVVATEEMKYWYQYTNTCMLLNAWDTTCDALNGADKDGDLFFTTNNSVLLRNIRPTLPIHCAQKKATKVIPTLEDFVRADKNGFGDEVGRVTNDITSQIDLQSWFDENSEEYKTLEYRILCGQTYQQNSIDKCKGIVSNPMPNYWISKRSLYPKEDDSKSEKQRKEFNRKIVADKKPFFFIYNYPNERVKYNKYMKAQQHLAKRKFHMELEDVLKQYPDSDFVKFHKSYMPVNIAPSLMNRLSWKIDEQVDERFSKNPFLIFDKSILKYDDVKENASKELVQQLKKLYKDFNLECQSIRVNNEESSNNEYKCLYRYYLKEALKLHTNPKLIYNTVIDICYTSNKSKGFCWNVFGDLAVKALLEKKNYIIEYPTKLEDGDFEYNGYKYKMIKKNVKDIMIGDKDEDDSNN